MGYLEHVRPGEIPSARKENKKIDAINSLADRLDTLYTGAPSAGGLRVTISNTGNSAVPSGGVLAVTGCRASGSFDKLKSLWMGGSIPLAGGALSASSPLFAFALEGIPAGGIGKALCPGLYAGPVTLVDANHQLIGAASGGLTTTAGAGGRFKILAKSEASNGKVFAFFYDITGGHRTGKTANGSGKGSNWSASVTIAGATVSVKCPLLRSDEDIENGTDVILSWNAGSNEWQVIEAQCPAS